MGLAGPMRAKSVRSGPVPSCPTPKFLGKSAKLDLLKFVTKLSLLRHDWRSLALQEWMFPHFLPVWSSYADQADGIDMEMHHQ
jgi:hypothetical protein